jgi:glycerol transport system ATP-binding protein
MYEGQIVQIGTPQELFENPSHTFVGYFIGSPGMNFLPIALDGQIARVGDAAIFLGEKLAGLAARATGDMKLGIRPLYLEVHDTNVDHGVLAQIKSVDDKGSFKIITAVLGGHCLCARIPEGQPIPQQGVWLKFPTDWIRLFFNDLLLT